MEIEAAAIQSSKKVASLINLYSVKVVNSLSRLQSKIDGGKTLHDCVPWVFTWLSNQNLGGNME